MNISKNVQIIRISNDNTFFPKKNIFKNEVFLLQSNLKSVQNEFNMIV